MATRQVTIIECDRCHEDVDPDQFKAEGGQAVTKPVTASLGGRLSKVWDLCPSCRVLHDRFLNMEEADN